MYLSHNMGRDLDHVWDPCPVKVNAVELQWK